MIRWSSSRRQLLRALGRLGLLSAASVWGRSATAQVAPPSRERVVWPEVTLLDGSRFGPAQAQGQHVIVVFWATFCPFCQRHNAHMEKLRQATVGRPIRILTVAQDRNAQAVRDYLKRNRYGFDVTLDHAPMLAAFAAKRVIPLTYVVAPDGRVLQTIPGEMFEEDVMEWKNLG